MNAPMTESMPNEQTIEFNRRAFDFIQGDWHIHNRRLKDALADDEQWIEFDARHRGWIILDGAGNSDEYRSDHRPGFVGMTLRLFDAQNARWSIYWMDNYSNGLLPPVVGSFTGDCGEFIGGDRFRDRDILARFIWSRTHSATPRWEQAFSIDQGRSWKTNWIMDFKRP